ncbi:hypothetical protein X801_06800, partial [Opisthorchis viverrini]
MPEATGLKVLEENIGVRGRVKQFKFLLVKQSSSRLKFLKEIKGVIGMAPKESSEMTYAAQTFDGRRKCKLSINYNIISVGGTTLCTGQCEVSFELGCARAYVPEDKRGLIAGEWKVPVVDGVMELQQSQLYLYEPLKMKVQSLEFEWPPHENHFIEVLIVGQGAEDKVGIEISVGGTTLCTEACEVSFELGCARAYVPEDRRGLIAGEWKVPVVEGVMELQQSQLYLYEPLKMKVQSLEFEWPPHENHFI